MKKVKLLFVVFCLIFLAALKVKASSNEEFFKVDDESSLIECFSEDNLCQLTANITLTSQLELSKKVILDLNGLKIEPASSLKLQLGLIVINNGSKLTIIDTSGNGKISTGSNGNVWAGIQLANNNDNEKSAELIVNSGTIEGYYYAITGNGKLNNTILTINGGTISALNTEDSVGLYLPQVGKTTINGGTITGGTGIEIRSGDLTINGGTIIGVAKSFVKMINSNGSTTNGVGVAVAQHTTKNSINVIINNGEINGQYAFYEWNPHNSDAIHKVKISINNGNFKTLLSGGNAVYSEDFTNFINGGEFNSDVSKYLSANGNVTTTIKTVEPKEAVTSNKSYKIHIILTTIGFLALIGFYYYKYKKTTSVAK